MAVLQGEFCAVNIEVAFRAKPNGRYIEVAVLQRAGIARVYCIHKCHVWNTDIVLYSNLRIVPKFDSAIFSQHFQYRMFLHQMVLHGNSILGKNK